jgi:CheY-like chemotaxis protein
VIIHPSGRKLRIYVVDDEPAIASTLAMILCKEGVDATAFTDPLVAVQAVRGDPPDLLLSDVVMPGLSGIELAVQVRQSCPDCKVVLFTGQPTHEDLLDIDRINAYVFSIIAKPLHPVNLLRIIRAAVDDSPPAS